MIFKRTLATIVGVGFIKSAASLATCSKSTCKDLGWDPALHGSFYVCGGSNVDGGYQEDASEKCSGLVTYQEAAGFCEGFGSRLCTLLEILSNEVRALQGHCEVKLCCDHFWCSAHK